MTAPDRGRAEPEGARFRISADDHPAREARPRRWTLVGMLALGGLLAGVLTLWSNPEPITDGAAGSAMSSLATGAAVAQDLVAAFSDGDRARVAQLVHDDPVALQWPDLFATPGTFEGTDEAWLGFFTALESWVTLADCVPIVRWGRSAELYDGMVTCTFRAGSRLMELLGAPPQQGWMDFGLRDGRVRAVLVWLLGSESELTQRHFRDWLERHRPHQYTHWLGGGTREPLYGGEAAAALLDLAEEYLVWAERPDAEPAMRPGGGTTPHYQVGHLMDYETAGGRVVLAGATDPQDLWAFDHSTRSWTRLVAAAPLSAQPALAYDSQSELLVVVGSDRETHTTTVRSYDPITGSWQDKGAAPFYYDSWWSQVWLRTAYDAGSDRVVAVADWGGFWAYDVDLDRWTEQLDPWSQWPPASLEGLLEKRRPPCLGWLPERPVAYDAASDLLVIAGRGDLCVYDLDTDTLTIRMAGDAPREVSAAAFDAGSDRVVLLGDGAIWAYHTPSGLLQRVGPVAEGVLWRCAAMAYDPSVDRMVVFDGGVTWDYDLDGDAWRRLGP